MVVAFFYSDPEATAVLWTFTDVNSVEFLDLHAAAREAVRERYEADL